MGRGRTALVVLLVIGWAAAIDAGESPAPAAAAGGAAAPNASALERRVANLEAEVAGLRSELEAEKEKEGFISSLGEHFDFGGQIEIDFLIDTQNETDPKYGAGTDEPDPRFRAKRLRLEPEIHFTKEIDAKAQIDLEPEEGESRVRELYARIEAVSLDRFSMEVRVGLEDRFMRRGEDYRTEEYPLLGTAFWKYEATGFFWRSEIGRARDPLGELNLHASLTTGYEFDTNGVGKDNSFEMLTDETRFDHLSLREIGGGVEYRKRFGDLILIEVLGFLYDDEMPIDDVQLLQSTVPGYRANWNLRGRRRYGVQGGIEIGPFGIFAQYMEADDGRLDRRGWYVEPRYHLSFERPVIIDKYLRWVEVVVNYGTLDVDLPRVTSAPTTWDRRRLGLGSVLGVTDDVLLRCEYYVNRERTGSGDPSTNEFLAQLELMF
ncbi:MAG: hypothetical protein JXP34_11555 [Planctomycetes bacterium]|nr:hypothetical protein [Planctomycetota bacterium]